MDRRRFLVTSLATTASLKGLAQSGSKSAAAILVRSEKRVAVPQNFVGLSFETQQLSDPSFFSASNTGLVARFRELAPRGVLRLGGNTSDYGFWKPTPASVAPARPKREYKVGDPPPDLSYGVTPEAVRNLRAFLDATGWSCLYGINFGNNTPELAADEASFATKTLGSRLEYLQVGNEADRFASTIRDPKVTGKPWDANAFLDEWLTLAKAIIAKIPEARFGMPDIASNAEWFSVLGDRLASDPLRSHIVAMTHHYYIGGPPSNPEMTAEHILRRDPRVARDAGLVRAAADKLGTHWRMTEGNTCYRGGKPGVSDVFAAALWSADYLLELASLGYSGVNLHGGDGQLVANSVGGKLPGDELVKDDPASHPHPYYTPIAHIGDKYVAEPVSFGMRFAQHFAGTELIPLTVETGGVNASVYMAKTHSGALLGVINKDASQPLRVEPPVGYGKPVDVEITSAPSYISTAVKVEQAKPAPGAVLTVGPCSMALFSLQV